MPSLCVYCPYRKDKDSDKEMNNLSCLSVCDEDSYWYSRALACKEYPPSCLNYVITRFAYVIVYNDLKWLYNKIARVHNPFNNHAYYTLLTLTQKQVNILIPRTRRCEHYTLFNHYFIVYNDMVLQCYTQAYIECIATYYTSVQLCHIAN